MSIKYPAATARNPSSYLSRASVEAVCVRQGLLETYTSTTEDRKHHRLGNADEIAAGPGAAARVHRYTTTAPTALFYARLHFRVFAERAELAGGTAAAESKD